MANGQQVGYVRVSSVGQNTLRQLDGIQLDKVFTDTVSGKDTGRPGLTACLGHLREGDTLNVHSMDRMARNLDDLRKMVKDLTTKGVAVRFVKEGLTFTGDDGPMANLLLSMLGAVAEFERSLIRERQTEGIALAKAKGVYTGRKPTLSVDQVAELKARVTAGESKVAMAKAFGISRETVYQYLRSDARANLAGLGSQAAKVELAS